MNIVGLKQNWIEDNKEIVNKSKGLAFIEQIDILPIGGESDNNG